MKQQTPLLDINVRSRTDVFFNGKARSISSVNESGPFDVLAMHANFITVIQKTLKIETEENGVREFGIDSGVMRVSENKVDVYLGLVK